MNKKIEICNYVNGGCTSCPLYDSCGISFQTIRPTKEWITLIDDKIYELQQLKKEVIKNV